MTTEHEITRWLYGSIATHGENDLISRCLIDYGEWARAEVEFICKYLLPIKGTFIDIGAFIGTHSIPFGLHVGKDGKGIAFEPNRSSFRLLTRNLDLAGLENITAYNMAASEQSNLHYKQTKDLSNFGASTLELSSSSPKEITNQIQYCIGKAIDDLHLNQVDLIKADVEGMENSVLKGCTDLITRCMPNIFLELNSLDEHAFALELAKKFNYKIFGIRTLAFNPANFNHNQYNILGNGAELAIVLTTKDLLSTQEEPSCLLSVHPVRNFDELSILLLSKPQYRAQLIGEELSYLLGTASYLSINPYNVKDNEEINRLEGVLSQIRIEATQAKSEATQAKAEATQARTETDQASATLKTIYKSRT